MIRLGYLFGLLVCIQAQSIINTTTTDIECQAGIDIYFVVDNSNYIRPGQHGLNGCIDFVQDIVRPLYDTGDFRTSVIYYPARDNSVVETVIPLTGNTTVIDAGIDELIGLQAATTNRMHIDEGLRVAYESMLAERDAGSLAFNLVILVAAHDNRGSDAAMWDYADKIKDLGGFVYVIGALSRRIGRPQDLERVASNPKENFFRIVETHADLPALAPYVVDANIISQFCIAIAAPPPHEVCHDNGVLESSGWHLMVSGTGLGLSLQFYDYECMLIEEGLGFSQATYHHGYLVQDFNGTGIDYIFCAIDIHMLLGVRENNVRTGEYHYNVEVALDGKFFTRSGEFTHLSITPCSEPVPVITWYIIGGGLLFLLFGLWWLWPTLCAKKVPVNNTHEPLITAAAPAVASANAPSIIAAPTPPVERKKKWKTVETSHYLWALGGGGAAPLHTNWGELGAVESAPGARLSITSLPSEGSSPNLGSIQRSMKQSFAAEHGPGPVSTCSAICAGLSCCFMTILFCPINAYLCCANCRPQPKADV